MTSWLPVDLAPVLDGTRPRLAPSIGERQDGQRLLYRGRRHMIVSETEAGKTWLALLISLQVIADSGHVLYVDFEDDEEGAPLRMIALQAQAADVKERFHYVRPDEPVTPAAMSELKRALGVRPALVVLDGVTDAMALHGLSPSVAEDFASFNSRCVNPFTRAGAATVALDHVVKDREGRGRYALGTVHKLNSVTGCSLILENRSPFGIGMRGESSLYVAKDRPGHLRRAGTPASGGLTALGTLVLDSHGEDFAEAYVTAPAPPGSVSAYRPTALMARAAQILADMRETPSKTNLARLMGGRRETALAAISHLINDGYVTAETGPRGTSFLRLARPYEQP